MILHCTGRSNRKALTSSLMCGSAAGSYTQWCSTDAIDMRCDIIVDGSSPSLKRCIMYVLKWWLLTRNTCHLFVLQNATNLDQWDSHTCCEDSRRHLDIMLAASLEWPFALRMARRVSTRVDLTVGSDESWSPRLPSKRLVSAGLDLRRTAGSDLLGIGPSTLWTMMLSVAVEQSKSPPLLVTERSSAVLEGPSWMAGRHTEGPSPCPKAWTWHLSTPPWGPDTVIRTWRVICWRMSQTSWSMARPPLGKHGS